MPDVLIVGAGPAGSIAGLVLARAGVRVQLLDRAEFPRDKLCGDTINPGALSILDRLGLGTAVRRRSIPVTGMTVTGPGGSSVSADYGTLCGAAIVRRDLDQLLLQAAIAAGVDFVPGMRVRTPIMSTDRVIGVRAGTNREHEFQARVTIAADGRHSSLAFALNLARLAARPRRWAFGAYFTDVDGLSSRGEMHVRNNGYLGVAPLPGGFVNVCVVRERKVQEGVVSVFSRTLIEDAIAHDSVLRDRFARARRVSVVTSLGPLAIDDLASGCPGLLLAGDAAGFVDPMTGDGLRFAFRGGELAADAALMELESGQPAYGRLRMTRALEFRGKWRLNRALRSLVASPRGVSLAASVGSRWQTPVRALISLAGDVGLAKQSL